MKSVVIGTTMPILELTLDSGEAVVAEGGDVSWLSPVFRMDTSTVHASGGQGGFMSGLERVLGGAQLFLTEYTASLDGALLAFAAQLPGTILEMAIDSADAYMIQSGSYVASTQHVEVSVALPKKLGAGIFGGAGVIFQKLAGNGTACAAGRRARPSTTCRRRPARAPGASGDVHGRDGTRFRHREGHQEQVLRRLAVPGGAAGPGHVWLQSMTPAKLAAAIEPYLPTRARTTTPSRRDAASVAQAPERSARPLDRRLVDAATSCCGAGGESCEAACGASSSPCACGAS